MNDQDRAGFLFGCAVGFDLDSDDVEALLALRGLTLADSLSVCQAVLRESMVKERWERGLRIIADRAG